jgi:hypothetical protein
LDLQMKERCLRKLQSPGLHQARFRPCQRWDLRFMGILGLEQVV